MAVKRPQVSFARSNLTCNHFFIELKIRNMKKFTLLLCAILFAGVSVLNGQVVKGKISVGATSYALGLPTASNSGLMSLGFGTSTSNFGYGETKTKLTGFNLQPKVGYLITDQFSAGLELLTSINSSKDEDEDGKDIESLILIGPFVRYYFPISKNYLYVEGEFGLGSYKYKWTGEDSYDEKYNVTAFGLGAGIFIPTGSKAGFDVSLGYQSYNAKYSEDSDVTMKSNSFGAKAGFLIMLGKDL